MRRNDTPAIGPAVMTDHLTTIPGAPSKVSAIPGMAYFADTGPLGARCKGCQFLGYHRKRTEKWSDKLQSMIAKTYLYGGCEQFKKLTGKHGPTVSGDNRACKYYKERMHKK